VGDACLYEVPSLSGWGVVLLVGLLMGTPLGMARCRLQQAAGGSGSGSVVRRRTDQPAGHVELGSCTFPSA